MRFKLSLPKLKNALQGCRDGTASPNSRVLDCAVQQGVKSGEMVVIKKEMADEGDITERPGVEGFKSHEGWTLRSGIMYYGKISRKFSYVHGCECQECAGDFHDAAWEAAHKLGAIKYHTSNKVTVILPQEGSVPVGMQPSSETIVITVPDHREEFVDVFEYHFVPREQYEKVWRRYSVAYHPTHSSPHMARIALDSSYTDW